MLVLSSRHSRIESRDEDGVRSDDAGPRWVRFTILYPFEPDRDYAGNRDDRHTRSVP